MDNALKLRVMFDMIDNMTKPLKNILAGSKGLAGSLKETRRELAEMGKTQKAIGSFRELHGGLSNTTRQLDAARDRVKLLAGSLREFGPPSQQMTGELTKARQAASLLRAEQKQQTTQLQEMRTRLAGAGIDTRNLAQHERELRANMSATTATMAEQMRKLDTLGDRERRVATARRSMEKMQGIAGNMAVSGYAARSTGMHMFGGLGETLDEAKKAQNEEGRIKALGLGDHATIDAVKFASDMKVYGASFTDNLTMMRDSMTIFADEHHAQMAAPTLSKMKFANEAMYGEEGGHENEEKFMNMLKVIELRGGTKDEATFRDEANRVQKVISATGGRVGGDQWMEFVQRGGVAAKSLSKDAFYYQMEPLIQEMGGSTAGNAVMSGYQNLIEGRTTVRAARKLMGFGLLDSKKVEYDKNGHVKAFSDGALLNSEQFKTSPYEWMQKTLLPTLAKQGITGEKEVLSTIGSIFTNRSASNLFATMYLQRSQIAKNERLNTGAAGITELNAIAQEQTRGKEIAALAELRDLKNEIGKKVTPLYNAGLQATASATGKVVSFMKEHGTAAKVVITALAVLAAMLVVGGSFTIALAGVLGPLALVKFSMQVLGMQGGILSRALGLGAGAFRLMGSAAMFAGRALLTTPIGWITLGVAALAGAAYLLYNNWGTVTGFFGGLWQEVRAAFAGGIGSVTALLVNWSVLGLLYQPFAAAMAWLGVDMPAKFSEFGAHMIAGLVNGITSGLGSVKDAIVNVASSTVGWFKEKLGIRSPSRVFAELGGFVAQGAALGMEGEQGRITRAAVAMATVATTAFGAPAFAQGAAGATVPLIRPNVPIDRRPPVTASQGAAAVQTGPAQIIINIYPRAGDDENAIARAAGRAVALELDRRERSNRARKASSLSDS
ncbi:hypothetical protein C7401_12681 [Paraburkholderia unamae]|uniref:phage tail tape measure protein n=1 Tax=Paraburkholderia unamae TaxID=219649 RepID=UPI000DC4DE62|nr:hypothetical protein [Paraburkholderia unamae]RAR53907.1 hypothetical protein C7401_12681 [Paraburkholderia unamae]